MRGFPVSTAIAALLLSQPDVSAAAHVTGTFEVRFEPDGAPETDAAGSLIRMRLDKSFAGGLQAVSKGRMLTAGAAVPGSVAYVAIEQVTGTLDGRSGGFALQHAGEMTRDAQTQVITVVPGSGSGQLAGIAGRMSLLLDGSRRVYEFDYTLP